MKIKTKLFFSVLMSAAILTFFLYTQYSKANTNVFDTGNLVGPILKIYFFDVGQGDSIFIKTPEGKDILIDGGPDGAVLERLTEVMPFWDRYIDIVVLTHPHQDHIAGLFDVLDRYEIGQVLEPDLINEPDNLAYFNKKTDKEEDVMAGKKIILAQDLEMNFLYPLTLQLNEENLNDTSLVFRLSYKDLDFLFTGDATSEVEQKILDQNLDVEFLKVGHHGSRYSSSQQFLEKATPLISIISVGAGNSFGHPTRDTLDRLNSVGSRILRTDKAGTVEVDVGGDGRWIINCTKTCN